MTMNNNHIGSARMEQTEDSVARIRIERPDGTTRVLYLEPGNGFQVAEDGPVAIEAFALDGDPDE